MYFDLFYTALPDVEEGNEVEQFYAIAKVNKGKDTFYHVQATQEQYLYHTKLDSKLVKNTTKLARKIFKSTLKKSGQDELTPCHVFGDSVICLGKKIKYNVVGANELISDDDKEKMLKPKKIKEVDNGIKKLKV